MIRPENPRLLERLQLFVVARPATYERLDREPFDVPVAAIFDPLRLASAGFLELLKALDEVTFGPEGMSMPRWVYLDGVELTGAIVGMAMPRAQAPAALLRLLGVADDYRGLVPCSVYMAIPMTEPDVWFGHNLASVAGWLPDAKLGGLGSLTKALALKVYRAKAQIGATQWASRALFVHTRLGALELLTAWTPAHAKPQTLTYRAQVNDGTLRRLMRDPGGVVAEIEPSEWISSDDEAAMQDLQARIEAGQRLVITGRPEPIAKDAGQDVGQDAGRRQRVPMAARE